MWPVCPSYFLHTDKLQISCLLGKVQGQSWSSWRYSGSLLVAPAGNKWNHNNCTWFIICTGQPLHVSSVKYLIKGASSRRCCLSRDATLQILVAATCYLTSCCLSMVSNESAHYDLWPLTSKKAFSITSLQFTSYFLLLGRFSVTSRGGCENPTCSQSRRRTVWDLKIQMNFINWGNERCCNDKSSVWPAAKSQRWGH